MCFTTLTHTHTQTQTHTHTHTQLLIYCCDIIPWPKQLTKESNLIWGLRFQKVRVHDHYGNRYGTGTVWIWIQELTSWDTTTWLRHWEWLEFFWNLKVYPQWHTTPPIRPNILIVLCSMGKAYSNHHTHWAFAGPVVNIKGILKPVCSKHLWLIKKGA